MTMNVYMMTPALRDQLHQAIDDEGWDDGYKGEAHEAVDLFDDGPIVSYADDLSTSELYAMFDDEDAPEPHLIGLINYFGAHVGAHVETTETKEN